MLPRFGLHNSRAQSLTQLSGEEGFSIPARLKLLKEYAAANGFVIAQEYVDVATAKQTGRAAFGEMVAYLKARPTIRGCWSRKPIGSTAISRIG